MPDFNTRMELDVYRLLEKTGNLAEASDFQGMAGLATKAGLPCEARRVLQLGHDAGVTGGSGEAALLDAAQKQCSAEAGQLNVLLRTANDANALKAVADVYGSQQNWDAANAIYIRALATGSARRPDELRLHHAMALFQAGDKAAAHAQLALVARDASARQIARLWGVLIQQF